MTITITLPQLAAAARYIAIIAGVLLVQFNIAMIVADYRIRKVLRLAKVRRDLDEYKANLDDIRAKCGDISSKLPEVHVSLTGLSNQSPVDEAAKVLLPEVVETQEDN